MSTEIVQAKTAVDLVLNQTTSAQELIESLQVEGPEDADFAGEILRDVKSQHKALEDKRKSITAPLLKVKREVDALFKPPREALELAERTLKAKIAGWLESVREANAAAVEAAGEAESPAEASKALATVAHVEAPQGVSVRHVWDAEVINPDLVPDNLKSPDPTKIREWMKVHAKEDGTPLAIPGIRFSKRPIVTSRG